METQAFNLEKPTTQSNAIHALYKQGVFPDNYAALRETLDLQEFYRKYKQDGSELDSLKGAQAENVEAEKQVVTALVDVHSKCKSWLAGSPRTFASTC